MDRVFDALEEEVPAGKQRIIEVNNRGHSPGVRVVARGRVRPGWQYGGVGIPIW